MINKVGNVYTVNNRKYQKQAEKESHENNKESGTKKFSTVPSETYKAYSGISFKGGISDNTPTREVYENAKDCILQSNPEDTVSVKEAVEILKPLNLSEKKLLDFLMACSFDTHNENIEINKHAVYYAILLQGKYRDVPPAKIPGIIATSLDNENKCFSEKQFESLFNAAGQLRMTKKNSLRRPREDNYPNARKIILTQKTNLSKEISKVLKAEPPVQNIVFNEEDIFELDLEKEKQSLIDSLREFKDSGKISVGLFNELSDGVQKNNLDLRKICSDYYSLLEDCKTLEEAKEIYPEIKIPNLDFEDDGADRLLRSRLAREDKDKIGLYILKQLYIEQKPAHMIFVELDNSYPTTYISMVKSGMDFGRLPGEVAALFDKTTKLTESFKAIDNIDSKTLEFMIRKNASKESRIWAEYMGITNKYWHPVRAIAHKQKHPVTSYYQTDKLVDGYLFYLYKYQNKSVPSENPFEKYADGKPFNKEKKEALENIYFMYKNNYNRMIKSEKFLEFKENFDTEAMAKSLTKLENHYKNTFSNWFMTPERRKRYEEALDNSYRLVLEKMEVCKLPAEKKKVEVADVVDDKLSNEALVDYIAETEEEETSDIKSDFYRLRNAVYSTNNTELIQLFSQYVGTNPEYVDYENFSQYEKLLDECIENDGIENPDSAIALFKLYNTYLNYLFNENVEQMGFDEYKKAAVERYAKTDGTIDYTAMSCDLTAEYDYAKIFEQSETEEETAILNILNKKFIANGKNDYKSALNIINMYKKLPDLFKTKFYSLAAATDKANDKIFTEQLRELYEKISSWRLDEDEIITMDADKIPQKIVITSGAKYQLLEDCNENIERFDTILNKFFSAASKRVGDRQGQGVKVLGDNVQYAAELKIQGSQAIGSKRLYARHPEPDDIRKYGNVKYVFDTLDKHL